MSVVSPKTLKARKQVTAILVKHCVGDLTMAQAEHMLWRIVNECADNYDEGYNDGYRASEDDHATREQRKMEPPYPEVR